MEMHVENSCVLLGDCVFICLFANASFHYFHATFKEYSCAVISIFTVGGN